MVKPSMEEEEEEQQQQQQQQVWSKLPNEIVSSIFSRLSVYDIVRAGCACRRLRSFLSSHSFISTAFSSSPLLVVHPFASASAHEDGLDPSGWAYDHARDTWIKLSLAFLQPNLPDFAYPVASGGGLLCFGSGRDFIVCNPISRSWRRLPTLPPLVRMENGEGFHVSFDEDSVHAFGLIWNPSAGTYEFFVINYTTSHVENGLQVMRYSSALSQWRGMRPLIMSELCKLCSNAIIISNARLYTLWEKGSSLVVFAFSNGSWSEIESPDCRSTLLKGFLMDVYGSLHMVGCVGAVWLRTNVWERPTSVRIWKLHTESNEWIEVTRMPPSILHELRMCIDFDELQCWGRNGAMYMKSSHSEVLMCDVGKRQWKWLKDLEMDGFNLGGGLILEPSLSASA